MRSLFERLQSAGFITLKIKKKSFDIVYGSRQIKEIFMEQGNLLELYTYCKAKELNTFDDVVTGVGFFRGADRNREKKGRAKTL